MALDIGSVATALRHSGLIGNQALQYGSLMFKSYYLAAQRAI